MHTLFHKNVWDYNWKQLPLHSKQKKEHMGYLKYKGYLGSVEFDDEKNILCGRVQGLRDELLRYQGESVKELNKNFQKSIDMYLDRCDKENVDPKRPYNGSLNVRLGPDLHGLAAMVAEQRHITINAFIKDAVRLLLLREERAMR